MKTRLLGNLQVSAFGLGCMGMSFAYGGAPKPDAIRTLRAAFDSGVTFFDTAEVYGPFENEQLLGEALAPIRDRVQIATKFGFAIRDEGTGIERMHGVDSRPEHIRDVVEASLRRLRTDRIDLLYQHRLDPRVPVEEVVGAMAKLVNEGKVLHLGLCEISAQTLRRAHAVHPIAAVQSEYSLWSRDPERAVLPTARELGIGFVPYSPLGRGWLTGKMNVASLADNDFRRTLPRFSEKAMAANQMLLGRLCEMANQKSATPAQIALAWLLAQDDHIVPIPGARRLTHLQENIAAAEITLTRTEADQLAAIFTPDAIDGARYPAGELALIET
ncbi:aldo/keto reductase [Affinibrenneria salicis]|uniref:Aldo/keto reductase n=1 Tax=Affinibrenneria salicis TaxID=2590031 RepID=A0A5J5G4E0_9GAMM|nr:aldo/keto reductase [Affinibrenneria salicis]KAA9001921.1 aldo/keto reductase [Affinibrenneria salicis]